MRDFLQWQCWFERNVITTHLTNKFRVVHGIFLNDLIYSEILARQERIKNLENYYNVEDELLSIKCDPKSCEVDPWISTILGH